MCLDTSLQVIRMKFCKQFSYLPGVFARTLSSSRSETSHYTVSSIIPLLLMPQVQIRQLKIKKVSTIFKTNSFVVSSFSSLFSLPTHSKYSDAPTRRILRFLSSQNVAQFKHACTFNNQGYIRFHLITDSGIVSLTQEMNHQATPQSITF
jgi:hypothetical protein